MVAAVVDALDVVQIRFREGRMRRKMKLIDAKRNTHVVIKQIADSDVHLLHRMTSIGLMQGTPMQVVKNDRKMPVLIYARETLMALNRKDAERIEVEQR